MNYVAERQKENLSRFDKSINGFKFEKKFYVGTNCISFENEDIKMDYVKNLIEAYISISFGRNGEVSLYISLLTYPDKIITKRIVIDRVNKHFMKAEDLDYSYVEKIFNMIDYDYVKKVFNEQMKG